jgi:hypothetical protein
LSELILKSKELIFCHYLYIVKFTALILFFCMLGMALSPAMPGMGHKGCHMSKMAIKSCCAGKHHEQKKNKNSTDDCCSNGGCMSFACCSCCMGTYDQSYPFKIVALTIARKLDANVSSFIPSDIVSDNFHPPELV